jgi:hypothetical protein
VARRKLSLDFGGKVTDIVRQGWLQDPAGRHEWRWFSQGTPTDLVKDARATSRDPIEAKDAAAYQSMDLAEEPDDRPPPHQDDAPPPLSDLATFGVGPVGVQYTPTMLTPGPPDPPDTAVRGPGAAGPLLAGLALIAAVVLVRLGRPYDWVALVLPPPAYLLPRWWRRRHRALSEPRR